MPTEFRPETAPRTGFGRSQTPTITALSVTPDSVEGGAEATATVALDIAAPPEGTTVTLVSDNTDAATILASLTVPARQKQASTTISSAPVATQTTVTFTATLAGSPARTDTLAIAPNPNPSVLASLSVLPTSTQEGNLATATVTLAAIAPVGGTVVSLASDNTNAATIPATVTVLADELTADATITTLAVDADTLVTFTASLAGSANQTDTLTVTAITLPPPTLTSLVVSPTTVQGGTSSTATVTLSDVAPVGGMVVTLVSSVPATASIPATATVLAGQTTANATVTTVAVGATTPVTFTASLSGSTDKTAILVVASPPGTLPTLSALRIKGDDFSTYTSTANFQSTAVGVGKLYNDGPNRTQVVLDTVNLFNGHNTIRYDQASGTASTPQLWPSLGATLANGWLRVVVQFSPDFDLDHGSAGAPSYKLCALRHSAGSVVVSSRIELAFDDGRTYSSGVPDFTSDDTTDFFVPDLGTDILPSGKWWDVILHRSIEPGPGLGYLRTEAWWREAGTTTPVHFGRKDYPLDMGVTPNGATAAELGINFNQVRTHSQWVRWGMWEVINGATHFDPYGLLSG